MQSFILMGGSDDDNGDYSLLLRMSASGETHDGWGCPKAVREGDHVWFYITAPISSIVAHGNALRDATRGDNWTYETTIGEIEWIDPHISKKELLSLFPDWGWVKATRGKVQLDSQKAVELTNRIKPAQNADMTVEEILSSQGAGFGDPIKNLQVEVAAIRFVREEYASKGFAVESVELQKIGYDLLVKQDSTEFHLEVKGVAGTEPAFIITENEKRCAEADQRFRLVVVTNALLANPEMLEITGKQLLSEYDFSPLAYRASSRM